MMNINGFDISVLHYLSEEGFISGKELSSKLEFSRVSVWKQIRKLKKLGYFISTEPRKGYRIISRPDLLLPQEIDRNLQTKYIGRRIIYHTQLTSTNSTAKNLINNKKKFDLSEGAVVIAETQTAGRGRMEKKWYSPYGGIWLTIVLFPSLEPKHLPKITLMAAVALAKTLKSLSFTSVHIKWPNDLLVRKRKLAGILTEMAVDANCIHYVLVGIGINANMKKEDFPEDIRKQSTSLQEILGKPISRVELIQLLLLNFEKYYNQLTMKQFEPILREWKENSNTIGEKLTILSAGKTITGEAIDLSPEGALIIRNKEGELVPVFSGTVQ